MKLVTHFLLWLSPISLFAAYPQLPHPYDEINWEDYTKWPTEININGNRYLIQVGSAGGCLVYGSPLGSKPPLEKIKKWGNYSAYYEAAEKFEGAYEQNMFGPYLSWNSEHRIISKRYADGKGAIRSYDKNDKPFHKEWHYKEGHSQGYYDLYGRIALEDRTTYVKGGPYTHQLYRNRKPCSASEYKFTKGLLMEHFELYEHPYSIR